MSICDADDTSVILRASTLLIFLRSSPYSKTIPYVSEAGVLLAAVRAGHRFPNWEACAAEPITWSRSRL